MNRKTILIASVAIILTIIIYKLPKAVVSNTQPEVSQNQDDEKMASQEAFSFNHGEEPSSEDHSLINNLREKLYHSDDKEKNIIFADSLAVAFQKHFQFDSAAKYLETAVGLKPGEKTWLSLADNYYQALSYSMDEKKSSSLAEKARQYYEKILTDNPDQLDVKSKVAMTYIATSNPMQGVAILREVLQKDPQHELATFNLGILSMQSNQLGKAINRFESLVKINPEHIQGRFYLAMCYYQNGDNKNARKHFTIVKEKESDPSVLATVEGYLKEIK